MSTAGENKGSVTFAAIVALIAIVLYMLGGLETNDPNKIKNIVSGCYSVNASKVNISNDTIFVSVNGRNIFTAPIIGYSHKRYYEIKHFGELRLIGNELRVDDRTAIYYSSLIVKFNSISLRVYGDDREEYLIKAKC